MFLYNIFYDYALLKTPRDPIFGMYTQMTARNDIRNILLHSMLIRDHQRSPKVKNYQKLTPPPRDTIWAAVPPNDEIQ